MLNLSHNYENFYEGLLKDKNTEYFWHYIEGNASKLWAFVVRAILYIPDNQTKLYTTIFKLNL
jgi:hypothetical protein